MMQPVEYLLIQFPGNKFKGEIVPVLADLTQSGIIQIIDLLFIKKDEAGNVMSFELSALGAEEASLFDDPGRRNRRFAEPRRYPDRRGGAPTQ